MGSTYLPDRGHSVPFLVSSFPLSSPPFVEKKTGAFYLSSPIFCVLSFLSCFSPLYQLSFAVKGKGLTEVRGRYQLFLDDGG
ncbi:MAG: hypothetical protein DRI91_04910 [Aquificota bacterium]|nr:MAG: hypothetical protein DRI91_04910 [Aquificota bacterium]